VEAPPVILAFDVGDNLLTPLVSGVVQGAIYGLLGLGLVLLYKGNRIFNFAQGEFGTVAALITFAFASGSKFLPKLPYALAIVLGILAGIAMGLLTERLVIRPMFRQPKVTLVVATAGVALFAIAVEGMFAGPAPTSIPAIIEGDAYNGGSLRVTKQEVLIVAVLGVLALATTLFFRYTQTGVAILAVSQEPTATSLVGISVNRISSLTWGMAGFLGAVAGILLSGRTGIIAPGFLTGVALIPAFTAAVFGGITSLPGAFVGGVVIGVVEQVVGTNIPVDIIPSANAVVVFAVLLGVLLFRPAGILGKEV
jgi:branched-chain amino acid transport system permease protein